jgi:hypothetical protein
MCHVFSNQSHDELQYYLSIGVSNDGMNNALGDTESAPNKQDYVLWAAVAVETGQTSCCVYLFGKLTVHGCTGCLLLKGRMPVPCGDVRGMPAKIVLVGTLHSTGQSSCKASQIWIEQIQMCFALHVQLFQGVPDNMEPEKAVFPVG